MHEWFGTSLHGTGDSNLIFRHSLVIQAAAGRKIRENNASPDRYLDTLDQVRPATISGCLILTAKGRAENARENQLIVRLTADGLTG